VANSGGKLKRCIMARPNKPYYWTEKKAWFVTIKGQRIKLGKEEEAAKKEFYRLMSLPEPEPKKQEALAAEVLDKFLLWVETNRAERTYQWYFAHLQAFLSSLSNQKIEASKIRPFHVTEWVKADWSATYTRGAMIAVQRAFKWAAQQGYIDKSPLACLEKPTPQRRENCPTKEEYETILSLSKGRFKPLLEFVWESGCRPQEVRILQPRHFKGDRLELMVSESKGKKHQRVIYLTDKAVEIVKKSLADNGSHIFVNDRGRQWTPYAINCRLCRIAKKTGKKHCFYGIRHTFATRMLEAGIDHVTLAALMGHRDASMICRVYSHVGQNTARLLEKLKSVQ
jgi:site-specific recombinase XerD